MRMLEKNVSYTMEFNFLVQTLNWFGKVHLTEKRRRRQGVNYTLKIQNITIFGYIKIKWGK